MVLNREKCRFMCLGNSKESCVYGEYLTGSYFFYLTFTRDSLDLSEKLRVTGLSFCVYNGLPVWLNGIFATLFSSLSLNLASRFPLKLGKLGKLGLFLPESSASSTLCGYSWEKEIIFWRLSDNFICFFG